MENTPNLPTKELTEKLPTMEQWKKYGSSAVTFSFMIIFVIYLLWVEFIRRDDCSSRIESFEKVILQKDIMIEQLNTRVSRLENALDVKNGVIKNVEEKVTASPQEVGGSK